LPLGLGSASMKFCVTQMQAIKMIRDIKIG
jgi:hypothetical protein